MISVIVHVYNVEKYLDRCVKSVVNSDFSDLEIILVDDGSTDNSGKLCDIWSEKDRRIKVVHQNNKGVSTARNVGLKLSKGEYIGFVDADDYISESMFTNLLKNLEESKSDIADCGYFEENMSDGSKKSVSSSKGEFDKSEAVKEYISNAGWHLTLWNKIFKREICFNKNDNPVLFPIDLTIGEDAVWLLTVTMKAKSVSYTGQAEYNYIINRPNSAVTNSKGKSRIKSCKSRFEASKQGFELLKSNNIRYSSLMYRRCVFSARDIAYAYYSSGDTENAKVWLKTLNEYLSNYKEMNRSDKMFILKNTLLYRLMSVHSPISLIHMILKR